MSTAADVYGLGVIHFFHLSGHPPVTGPMAMAVHDRLATAAPGRTAAYRPARDASVFVSHRRTDV